MAPKFIAQLCTKIYKSRNELNDMKVILFALLTLLMSANTSCRSQNKTAMTHEHHPLLCNPEKGLCEMPGTAADTTAVPVHTGQQKVTILYFTDPICSSCWGIEPQLRKLKLEYGSNFTIEYRMGGLLPDWSYNSGGISKPSDVAHHWDEVSGYYDMPIDGDVWLEDPLPSSYPPSIAFKAAQLQSTDKAIRMMRILREMVFLQKKNITRWEFIAEAAQKAGLDATQLKADYEGKAIALFQEDLQLARKMGVRGFPTMIFRNDAGQQETVYGSKPYAFYEVAMLQLYPEAKKKTYAKDWSALFAMFPSMTAREFSELSGNGRKESEALLNELHSKGLLDKWTTKNGAIWYAKQ